MATNKTNAKRKPASTMAAPANSTPVTATPASALAILAIAPSAHATPAPAKAVRTATLASWRVAGAACMANATPGKCQHVWQYCHTQHAAGQPVSAALYGAAYPTANTTNTQIEVGLWARTNGVVLARAPRKANTVTVAPPQPQA